MVYTQDGKRLKEIAFSGKKLTCTTWGGSENNILYITSGAGTSDGRDPHDDGGYMFMCKTDARGLPKREFAG
jgi:sugar lactone lactonase YvrE